MTEGYSFAHYRGFNYPHQIMSYYGMYRVARYHEKIPTIKSWQWYKRTLQIYIYIYISYSTVEFYYANAMHEDTVWDLQDMKRFRSVSSRGCGLRPQMYVDGRPHNLYDVVCFTFYFTKKKVPRTCFKHKHSTWVFEMWIYGWHCALVGSF